MSRMHTQGALAFAPDKRDDRIREIEQQLGETDETLFALLHHPALMGNASRDVDLILSALASHVELAQSAAIRLIFALDGLIDPQEGERK